MADRVAIVNGGPSRIGRAGAIGFAWNGKSVPGADLKAGPAAAGAQDILAGGGFVATGVPFDSGAA
jgi:NAD(P)-dependent dehydrogenase (short-subunit alcohol dehydrogenase family)